MRWLYHVRPREPVIADGYVGPAYEREGFTHCSFADRILESAALYYPDHPDLELLQIDPRRLLGVEVQIADTKRGPMPHIHAPIPRDAVRRTIAPAPDVTLEDEVRGTQFCFLAFDGMTLLDLVGVHDPIVRLQSMGFDPLSTRTIAGASDPRVWSMDGAHITVDAVLPPLDEVDVLVLPGGPNTRSLQNDPDVTAWIASFPHNRLLATVCTGALLAGAAGRLDGRRATTHRSALADLAAYGATVVEDRVVVDPPVVTAGGVTAGIDLGLYLVELLVSEDARRAIADRMEVVSPWQASRTRRT